LAGTAIIPQLDRSDYLLTSIAYCGLCGGRENAIYFPCNKRHSYACVSRRLRGTCAAPYQRGDEVERQVKERLSAIPIDEATREEARRYLRDVVDRENAAARGQLARLEAERKQHTKNLNKLARVASGAGAAKDFPTLFTKERVAELMQEDEDAIRAIDAEIARVGAIPPPPDVEEACRLLEEMEWEHLDAQGWRECLLAVTQRVVLYPDRIEVEVTPDYLALDAVRKEEFMPDREPGKPLYFVVVGSPENFRIAIERGFDLFGFKSTRRRETSEMQPGDKLIFYLTGIKKFGGIAEVTSEAYEDHTPVFRSEKKPGEDYPFRVRTKADIVLDEANWLDVPNYVPLLELTKKGQMKSWSLAFQGNLHKISEADYRLLEKEMRARAKAKAKV